jgi:hypothetical protein
VARFLKFKPKFLGPETVSEILGESTNKPFAYGFVSLSTSTYVGSVLEKNYGARAVPE